MMLPCIGVDHGLFIHLQLMGIWVVSTFGALVSCALWPCVQVLCTCVFSSPGCAPGDVTALLHFEELLLHFDLPTCQAEGLVSPCSTNAC